MNSFRPAQQIGAVSLQAIAHEGSGTYSTTSIANNSQQGARRSMGHDTSQIARRCERAVITAYRDLRQLGSDDMAAFQACTTLYRIHHPESSMNEARVQLDQATKPAARPKTPR